MGGGAGGGRHEGIKGARGEWRGGWVGGAAGGRVERRETGGSKVRGGGGTGGWWHGGCGARCGCSGLVQWVRMEAGVKSESGRAGDAGAAV